MGEVKNVTLYGSESSSFCLMVHHGLKLKGVAYEYVEEDLQNKSESLLKLNPVHKKVPVLVVDGRPIAESLVILEYIDETWKDVPLLPQDPYKRSVVRFWANFIYQKLAPASYNIIPSKGEEQEKAVKEFLDHMKTIEEGIAKDLSTSGGPFTNGEKPGLFDVIIGSCYSGFRVLGELAGVELLDKEKTPLICSCVAAYIDLDVIKDTFPDHGKMLQHFRAVREKAQAGSGNQ